MGKSETEAYWQSNSEVNTVGRGLRFPPKDRTVVVIKLFITWHTKIKQKSQSERSGSDHFTSSRQVRAQARNWPVDITGEKCPTIQWLLANQSAHYIAYKHKPYKKNN